VGKLYSTLGILLLSVAAVVGQGTFEFTWHGDSNVFQASFSVTGAEMQPGAAFSSPLFLSSMSVTNPLGQTYHGADASSDGSGSYIPWVLGFQLNDFQRSTEVLIHSGDYAGSTHRTSGEIREETFSGVGIFYERGYWSVAQVPEPSTVAVLGVGGLLWLSRRRR
jgi:hypothetical protein